MISKKLSRLDVLMHLYLLCKKWNKHENNSIDVSGQ